MTGRRQRTCPPPPPTTTTTLCVCVCQGINSNHAQTARFNIPTSYHYCKSSFLCSALHEGNPYRLRIYISNGGGHLSMDVEVGDVYEGVLLV